MPRKQKHLQVVKFRTKRTLFKIQPCICLLVMLNLWFLPNYSLKNLDFINNYNNLDGKKNAYAVDHSACWMPIIGYWVET